QTMGQSAIMRGRVVQGPFLERKGVPNVRVVAQRAGDNLKFVTITDADGRYEFQPLPPGKYGFTAEAIGVSDDKGWLDLQGGVCRSLTLAREEPKAQLGGHVQRFNGAPVAHADVLIMKEDESWFTTSTTDARGYYHLDFLRPGKYVV